MAENTVRTLNGGRQHQSQQKESSSSLNRVPHWDSAEER
jgi:hypothetical protein